MYGLLTDRARRIIALASEVARRHDHSELRTDHLLIGIVRVEDGLAANALRDLGVTPDHVSLCATDESTQASESVADVGHTAVIGQAKAQANSLRDNYIGTEHVLLGLVSFPESLACRKLTALHVDPSEVRARVLTLLGKESATVTLSLATMDLLSHVSSLLHATTDDQAIAELCRRHLGNPNKAGD